MANPPPVVSILLPVLNAQRFLGQALASLEAQTFQDYEVIIVDGGSTDGTAALAQAAPRARFMPQSGPGLASAWNTGLQAARGRYISFIESDDLWSAEKLAWQVSYLEQHPADQFVIGQVQLFLEPGCALPPGLNPAVFEGSHLGRMPGTLMARRALFEQVGLFDPRWQITPDIEWFARLEADAIPGGALPHVLLLRRIHDKNLTQVMGAPLIKTELLRLLKQNLDRRRRHAVAEAHGD
jgi:glycosyltransferase involved in cell wall biosynthesis